jgi:hypothetical protein
VGKPLKKEALDSFLRSLLRGSLSYDRLWCQANYMHAGSTLTLEIREAFRASVPLMAFTFSRLMSVYGEREGQAWAAPIGPVMCRGEPVGPKTFSLFYKKFPQWFEGALLPVLLHKASIPKGVAIYPESGLIYPHAPYFQTGDPSRLFFAVGDAEPVLLHQAGYYVVSPLKFLDGGQKVQPAFGLCYLHGSNLRQGQPYEVGITVMCLPPDPQCKELVDFFEGFEKRFPAQEELEETILKGHSLASGLLQSDPLTQKISRILPSRTFSQIGDFFQILIMICLLLK